MRLAESAYASGSFEEGDRLWATGTAGQDPLRAVKLSSGYDLVGDWSDLHTRILRQAGGTHWGRSNGIDPNPARQARRDKKGIVPPPPEEAKRHRELARILLARAAEGADKRLAIDLPAAEAGETVPLGSGRIDPTERRLFLHEIFGLQAGLAREDGDEEEHLRLLFKAQTVLWSLRGKANEAWRWGNEDELIGLAMPHDDATLQRLGMPAYLAPLLATARGNVALEGSEEGAEQLFWRRFMATVRETFIVKKDDDWEPLPGEELAAGFSVAREGGEIIVTHEVMAEPVRGSLSTPVMTALRAWRPALKAAHGIEQELDLSPPYKVVTLGADDLPILARIAEETLAAGATAEAVALYRFAHGTDPLLQPWPYRDAIEPLPLEQVPGALREAVSRRSPLEETGGHAKVKPRGRRTEQLARDYVGADSVTARYIADCLRDACGHAGESEIDRANKSGQPLLLSMWRGPDPMVREIAILAIFGILRARRLYFPVADLIAAAAESGIADMAEIEARVVS